MTTNQIARIHNQLRAALAAQLDAHPVADFTCFFNPDDDSTWSNAAIPNHSESGRDVVGIQQMIDTFFTHSRTPNLEYIAEFAPDLADALETHGFIRNETAPLMACTRKTFTAAKNIVYLQISVVDDMIAMQSVVTIQRRSFGSPDAPAATAAEAEEARNRFHANSFYVAKLNGEPAAAGSLQLPYNGIAEVSGIATLPDYRRRGIASAITSTIAQQAFDNGLDTLFIMAADQNVRRIYARLGFEDCGTVLTYSKQINDS